MAKKKKARLRRFNGTGSVYMLSGRRAKPWVARIIVGKDDNGKNIYRYTFHKTSTEAALAIPDMQRGVISAQSKLTIMHIWEQFKTARFPKLTQSTIKGYELSFMQWKKLHDREIHSLRASDLQ